MEKSVQNRASGNQESVSAMQRFGQIGLRRTERRIKTDGLPEFGYGFIHAAKFGERHAEAVQHFRAEGSLLELEGGGVLCKRFVQPAERLESISEIGVNSCVSWQRARGLAEFAFRFWWVPRVPKRGAEQAPHLGCVRLNP